MSSKKPKTTKINPRRLIYREEDFYDIPFEPDGLFVNDKLIYNIKEKFNASNYSKYQDEIYRINNYNAVELMGHFFVDLNNYVPKTYNPQKKKYEPPKWKQLELFLRQIYDLQPYNKSDFPGFRGSEEQIPIDTYKILTDCENNEYKLPVEIKKVEGLLGNPPAYIHTSCNQITWLKTKGDFTGVYLIASLETGLKNRHGKKVGDFITIWKVDVYEANLTPISRMGYENIDIPINNGIHKGRVLRDIDAKCRKEKLKECREEREMYTIPEGVTIPYISDNSNFCTPRKRRRK